MSQRMDEMMQWIGKEVCHTYADRQDAAELSDEALEGLYRPSKAHDLTHVVGSALFAHRLLPEGSPWTEKFKKQMMVATFRYEQSRMALAEICAALEEAQVPFLPLKGSVLRDFYPEPWMRTGCDIDVLVRERDLERASAWLETHCGYRRGELDPHDLSMFSPLGVHLELHYDLVEDGIAQRSRDVLQAVWSSSSVKEGTRYHYEMTDAMFYFYHVAHMAKHFEIGGCGVRPFLDLWILHHRVPHDERARATLLEQGGLLTFAGVCRSVSEAWFSGAEADELTRQTQAYVWNGGVYGSDENRITVQQGKTGGKLSYALSKIFLPYDTLKFHYPILRKHKWLLPVMEVRRWGKLIFCGGMKRSARELKVNQAISKQAASETRAFVQRIGL